MWQRVDLGWEMEAEQGKVKRMLGSLQLLSGRGLPGVRLAGATVS
jgi:hypothetical protein